MKTLYIVRHAKSSWDDFSVSDHERPLLPKGRNRTILVADRLKETGQVPELILSSTAKRAAQTAEIIAQVLGYPKDKILFNKNLYHASADDVMDELFGLDNEINSVMVVAHNPGLTDLANYFLSNTIGNLPTSGVVKVVFDTDRWETVPESGHKVELLLMPKNLE
jgi:phosphohistidine phosphatase